jgi:hypothetical protein
MEGCMLNREEYEKYLDTLDIDGLLKEAKRRGLI